MANVELKTDFKDGEVLFGEQLNNNFKAIKAALEAANKIAWQDNLDDEIIAFKGTTEEVEHRPIINGQLVYDVEQGFAYIDIITYSEENYPTLVPQRIKLSGGGEGIATIDSGDYADIIEEGIYLIKSNKVTDRLSSMSGTISKNYNKLMYVLNSGGSARPNVKQVLMDGFDFYIRTAYLNGTSSASSATEWEKRTIGEGGTGGSSIHIGEEEPTDDSTLWIDPDSFDSVGTEVVDSLEGDENLKAPSVAAVNKINTYSTEETFTGKYWIDGKKIYRKVIDVGNLPNADVKNINHNIVGLENITFSYGNASNGSTHINIPNVHAADLISQVAMFVTNELIRITTGSDRSTYIGYVILEYTKTTDIVEESEE